MESIDQAARQCCLAAEQTRRIAGMAERAAAAVDSGVAALSVIGRQVDAMITREAAASVLLHGASANLSRALSYRVIGSGATARSLLHLLSAIQLLDSHGQRIAAAVDVLTAAGLPSSTLGQPLAAAMSVLISQASRFRQVFVAESTTVPPSLAA